MNPSNPHGLGATFSTLFLAQALGNNEAFRSGDWSDLIVERETDRIDILLHSTRHSFVCAIENKIWSGEHGNQLANYETAVQNRFGDEFRQHFILLAPTGTKPPSRPTWKSVTYNVAIDALEQAARSCRSSGDVARAIDHYAQLLRRHVEKSDRNLVEQCRAIYSRHRLAFELIRENAGPALLESEAVRDVMAQQPEVQSDVSISNISRYWVSAFDRFPELQGETAGWGKTKHALLIEIWVKPDTETNVQQGTLEFKLVGNIKDSGAKQRLLALRGRGPFMSAGRGKDWPRLYDARAKYKGIDQLKVAAERQWNTFKKLIPEMVSEMEKVFSSTATNA
jgi:hypothetical protein